ncbi:hypothetical protein ZOSMA_2G03030 [Zostera marina]|uniref:Uncharacterized protein n=1 Tax=Zostera marina TaxID=29655 RepID=A0A0K9PBE9_ZOSMR|nr:hypothetical protein ZOSMA_2G03030 [Zostera marina]
MVYLLTILKGLKHRHAAGARLPNLTILFPVKRSKFLSPESEKRINVAGRVGCAVSAMLRRLGLHYKGDESYGKIRISGISLRRWFKPKVSFTSYAGKLADFTSSKSHLAKEITNQQRNIRSSYRID